MNDDSIKNSILAAVGPDAKTVSFFDPRQGHQVEKTIKVPNPSKVTSLPSGATVQEIESMDALKAMWKRNILEDVVTPLTHHSRQILVEQLKAALHEPDEHEAVDAMASTWQPPDDIALKVMGRLIGAVGEQRQGRENDMNARAQLLHEKELWIDEKKRLVEEQTALTKDVVKLVKERDDALRRARNEDTVRANNDARGAREGLAREIQLHAETRARWRQTDQALTNAIRENAELTKERDALIRNAQRETEITLTEYENEVTKRLTSVAVDHKKLAEELARVLAENASLKGERNVLRSQVKQNQVEINQRVAKAKREERIMSVTETTPQTVDSTEDILRSGDEVFTKVAGEGPYVLLTQVDEAHAEYANPISGKKNHFNCGKLPLTEAWLVRCKDGSMRTLPAAALTKKQPKSSFSFGGVKRLVTSDVTAKLFQATIWITILTLLYLQRAG